MSDGISVARPPMLGQVVTSVLPAGNSSLRVCARLLLVVSLVLSLLKFISAIMFIALFWSLQSITALVSYIFIVYRITVELRCVRL